MTGRPTEFEERIEEWTAEILEARSAIFSLDAFVRALRERGSVTEIEALQAIEWLNAALIGSVRGQQCARWCRTSLNWPGEKWPP